MAENVSKRSLIYEILVDFKEGKKSAKEAEQALQKIEKQAKKSGTTIKDVFKGAFGAITADRIVRELITVGKEAIRLGLKAQGVQRAFHALNNPNLLSELRKATRGTVEDLILMQAAVRADKFKIPLNNLAKLFQFAAKRARETGQEVGFLVDSIIDGIGRKSPLILDNLGIRAQDLQDEFKKTGDFAEAAAIVIEREMGGRASDALETYADKLERLQATSRNILKDVGITLLALVADTGDFFKALVKGGPALAGAAFALNEFKEAAKELSLLSPAFVPLREELERLSRVAPQIFTDAGNAQRNFQAGLKNLSDQIQEIAAGGQRGNLGVLNAQLDVLKKRFTDTNDPLQFSREELAKYTRQIEELEKAIKELSETYVKVSDTTTELAAVDAATINRFELDKQKDFLKTTEIRGIASEALIKTLEDEKIAQMEEAELRRQIASDSINIISSSLEIFGASAKAQTTFATLEILANQAIALSKAVASIKGTTGIDYIAQVASVVSTVFATFAQITNVLNQAKSQQGAADSAIQSIRAAEFAEGTEYLERGKHPKGKDTIPIWANEGEAIIPTEDNLKYPGLARAWIEGDIDDWIRQNYVNPALILKGLEKDEADPILDYSQRFYRQLIETKTSNSKLGRAISHLSSIDRKLNSGIPDRYA